MPYYKRIVQNNLLKLHKAFAFVCLVLICGDAVGQAPNISYQTPQAYNVNTAITQLSPANTGGSVPATAFGMVTTYAGSLTSGSNNGPASTATFNFPRSTTTDAAGNLYVSDENNNVIRKITPAGIVSTFAGSGTFGYADGIGTAASFRNQFGIVADPFGNIYVADFYNQMIRKITLSGIVTTLAGSLNIGHQDGTGTAASFSYVTGIATDAAGVIYVADGINNRIRKITPAGVVTTVAGNGQYGANNGNGAAASFSLPYGVAVDAGGNIYVADHQNHKIRKIDPLNNVTTYAGTGTAGLIDGPALTARFNDPTGVAFDNLGNLYVSEQSNFTIRKITPGGVVSTIAGNGTAGFTNGLGTAATFTDPQSISYDGVGNLFVTDKNSIRKISIYGYSIDKPLPAGLTFDPTTGIISGTPTAVASSTVYTITAYNASGSSSTFLNITVNNPLPVSLPAAPNISYHTPNSYAFGITITPSAPTNTGGVIPATVYGQVTTFTGSGSQGATNGGPTVASFDHMYGLAMDAAGVIYVADCNNQLIRKVVSNGTVSTLAGSGAIGKTDGAGTAASFNNPGGVTTDVTGNIYVGDQSNNLIRKITPAGVVTTLAGTSSGGANNGISSVATFNGPAGMVFDASGNLYVADRINNMIRMITPGGVVSTFAGSGATGSTNATGTSASFNQCTGLALDQAGNMYTTDQYNSMIRKITPAGLVTTLAGNGSQGAVNGTGTGASFNRPFGLAVDYPGNVYVADEFNHLIRKVTPLGVVTTIAGTGSIGVVDGIGKAASFNYPDGIVLDGLGNGYISETLNHKIRKIVLTGYTIDKVLPSGLTFDPTTGIISGTPNAIWPLTTYTVTAYNTGGSSSTPVDIEVVAAGVTFNPLPAKLICDADFAPGATSPLPITYSSSNTAVATIVNGKIHIVGSGTTVITAAISTGSTKQTLTVTTPPTPVVTISPDFNSICTGMQVTYTAKVTNGGTSPVYQWQLNGVNVGANSATYATTTIASADAVQCVVTNNDTCPVSGTSNKFTGIIVTPYTTPTISITSSATGAVCPGTPITFTAAITNGGANPTYQWVVNGGNAGTNSPTFTTSSLANGDVVICRLTNQGGMCLTTLFATSNAITVSLIAFPNPLPTVTITASANSVILGTAITFTAATANTGSGVVAYQWKVNHINAGSNSSTFTTTDLKNNDVVTCELTVIFACSITITSQQIIAVILGIPPLIIPNTFTPNADGVNDTWNITNLSYYPNSTISVFNRYGALLYQSKGYSVPWDGTYKGKALPIATYQYIIDTGTDKVAGSVAIIR